MTFYVTTLLFWKIAGAVFLFQSIPPCVGTDYPTDVSPEELMAMIKAGTVKVFDVRNPYELRLEGRIAGATNIPLKDIKDAFSMSPAEFQAKYKVTQPAKDDCNVVFHCKAGFRSTKAMQITRELGYFCVRQLVGGFDAWKRLYGLR